MSAEPIVMMTKADLRALVVDAVAEVLAANDPAEVPALLDRNALARALGVSARTVARLRELGMPTVWVVQSPRFELPAVLEWLRSNSAHLERHGQTPMSKLGDGQPTAAVLPLVPTQRRKLV